MDVQIAKAEKERQDKEDAAVSKWQEEQAAKQVAAIAAAIARQQRAQDDLEQVNCMATAVGSRGQLQSS